jgi:hypothetical protein
METTITPNAPVSTGTEQNTVPSMDSIAAKMTAMREQTLRNQIKQQPEQAVAGQEESADTSSPVAPDSSDAVAEIADTETEDLFGSDQEEVAQEAQEQTVSEDQTDSTADELIDFIEFAETNPNAKFKFMKNGKEVVIDAKKAAAILGQGSAIHEEARQLKIERAEFDEYINETRARQEGLLLAMEFTVEPRMRQAYDEIVKTQNYQTTFQQQLARTNDPAQIARIQASMQQNEQYIRQQQAVIGQLKPAVDQFRQVRNQHVMEVLEDSRRNFTDKELRNEYVFNEIRTKLSKEWKEANSEIVPGVKNIDLVSGDEGLLSLIRDGLRYRNKPQAKSAGASIATLTSRKGSTATQKGADDSIAKLREQANKGDKKAADNLLVAQLQRIRAGRGGR